MLGNLFIIFVLGLILATVIATIGDDLAQLWQNLAGFFDPTERALRDLRRQVGQ